MYLVRPKSALVIPMPNGRDLPPGGAIVPQLDLYWRRRRTDGDVTIDQVAAETVEAATAELAAAAKATTKAAASANTETKG